MDKRSVNELARLSFVFVCSSFEDISSLFDMIERFENEKDREKEVNESNSNRK